MSGAYNLRKRTNPIIYSDDAGQQLKLTDLRKVVIHPAGSSSVCFTAESVLEARAVLDNPLSTSEQAGTLQYGIACRSEQLVTPSAPEVSVVLHDSNFIFLCHR